MKAKGRVRPSKISSAYNMIIGIVAVCIGIFYVIPNFDAFGYLWTLMALGGTIYNAVNLFLNTAWPKRLLNSTHRLNLIPNRLLSSV